jgi:hypothetical protein
MLVPLAYSPPLLFLSPCHITRHHTILPRNYSVNLIYTDNQNNVIELALFLIDGQINDPKSVCDEIVALLKNCNSPVL